MTPLDELTLTVRLTREADTPDQWTARCLELGLLSVGATPEVAFREVAEFVRLMINYRSRQDQLPAIDVMRRLMAFIARTSRTTPEDSR